MPALKLHHLFPDFSAECFQIGVSPDSRFLAIATATQPATISLCDTLGKTFAELRGHNGSISAVDFSSDGRFLASSSADGTVRIWRPTGEIESIFDRFSSPPGLISFSPQVPIIAAAERSGLIVLFDIEANYIATLHSPKGLIRSLGWSSDNEFLIASCADNNLYLYNIAEQKKKVYIHPGEVLGAVLPEDDEMDLRCVLSLCADGLLRKIPSADSHVKTLARVEQPVAGLSFLRSVPVIALATSSGRLTILDLNGIELSNLNAGFTAARLMSSNPASRLLFLAGEKALAIYTVSDFSPAA